MSDDLAVLVDKACKEFDETKRKLEIAVKGLKDIKEHFTYISGRGSFIEQFSPSYIILNKCLKDLGVE